VNGTQFRKMKGKWVPERGRRGKLLEENGEFVYVSLDGTRYAYGIPSSNPRKRVQKDSGLKKQYMRVASAVFYSLGISPEELLLYQGASSVQGGSETRCEDASRLRRIEDKNGNTLQLHYNNDCQLTSVQDAVSRRLLFHYKEVETSYDNESRLDRIEFSIDGQKEGEVLARYDYNEQGLLADVTRDIVFNDQKESTWKEHYNYVKEREDDEYEYNLSEVTDANQKSTSYKYFSENEIDYTGDLYSKPIKSEDFLKSTTYPGVDNEDYPGSGTVSYRYDFSENKRYVKDQRGHETAYTLNRYGNPLVIEEPMVTGESVEHAKKITMEWSIDKAGEAGNDLRLWKMTNRIPGKPAEERTYQYTYTYNDDIWEKRETDPNGKVFKIIWDNHFEVPRRKTDRNGNSQNWRYDTRGNLLSHRDGEQKETRYENWPTGEIKKKTLPKAGGSTSYDYDAYGNPDKISLPSSAERDLTCDPKGHLIKEVDPHGLTTLYRYDSLGRLREIEEQPADGSDPVIRSFGYYANGEKMMETDRNGLELHYTYTGQGLVKSIERRHGVIGYGKKIFFYDPNGNLELETDWYGQKDRATKHTYDARNRRITTTNRLGDTMTRKYDTVGNLVEVTDFAGTKTKTTYDKLNREILSQVYNSDGKLIREVSKTYYNEVDPKANLKTLTVHKSNAITGDQDRTTTYEYNKRDFVTQVQDPLQTTIQGPGLVISYDDNGNKKSETDPLGRKIEYEYDNENRLTLKKVIGKDGGVVETRYDYSKYIDQKLVIQTDSLGKTTKTYYDPWNRVKKIVDAEGYTQESWYDGEGNIIKTQDGRGNTRRWVRDARGLVTEYYDAAAKEKQPTYKYEYTANDKLASRHRIRQEGSSFSYVTTQIEYDAEDREKQVTEALGLAEERTQEYVKRDKMGNPTQVKDYRGNTTRYEYNALYKVKKEIDSKNSVMEYAYTPTGKLWQRLDKRESPARTTTYKYDLLDRVEEEKDPLNQTVKTTYDPVGNVLSVEDKRGILTEFEYDDLYRKTKTIRAGQQVGRKVYNAVGNVTEEYDALDRLVRSFEYNDRHLLSKTTFYNDGGVTSEEKKKYDSNGNVEELTDREGKLHTFTYDPENRPLTESFQEETTAKKYDVIGNLIAVVSPEGQAGAKFAGAEKRYKYNGQNLLVAVTDEELSNGGTTLSTRYQYDKNSNLIKITDPLGNQVEYKYDELNRKTQHIQHKASGNLVTRFEYDNVGNLKKITDPNGQEFNYDYDLLNRRTDADYPDVPSPLLKLAHIDFEYDPNNNLKKIDERKLTPANTEVIDSIENNFDNFDRLDDSTQRGALVDYTYDNNGNRLSVATPNGSTSYTYSLRNQVKTVTHNSETTSYAYLLDGKLDTIAYPNGTDVKYTYHPNNRVEKIRHRKIDTDTTIAQYSYSYDKNGNRETQEEVNDQTTETTSYLYDPMNRLKSYTITDALGNKHKKDYTYEGYNRKTENSFLDNDTQEEKSFDYDETN
jgi:YD repeat-containing protein